MKSKTFWAPALTLLGASAFAGCVVTPTPLSDADFQQNGQARQERWAEVRTPIKGPLTLNEAISRAIRYNLDHRVEVFEAALKDAELGVSRAAMLPTLAASANRTERDKPLASSSYNLVTNTQNFGYSTSQDERQRAAEMGISWNILDFGLSYVRAKQAADKVLIADENRRKVVQKLIGEVRSAYWRAWAAQRLRARLAALEKRVVVALTATHRQAVDRTTSPVAAITFRRELIEIQRVLQELQREQASARYQLAALVNEKPNATFPLVAPAVKNGRLAASADSLIATALEKRPELRELTYRRRINAHEAEAALLELLPGIQLFAGANVDSNSFLLHDNWVNWGVKASWNVMRLFQMPARRELIESQDAALAQRELALTLAVMTQVHVGRARVAVLARERDTAKAYSMTQAELLTHIRAEFSANKISEQTLLREELNDAVGQLRTMAADAAHQSARADLDVAVGQDPVMPVIDVAAPTGARNLWALRTSVRRDHADASER